MFIGGGDGGVHFIFIRSLVYAMECILLRFENDFTVEEKKICVLLSYLFCLFV